MKSLIPFLTLLFTLFISKTIAQQSASGDHPTRQDTLKGSITPERRWWDVQQYDLTIEPDYESKTITGSNTIQYKIIEPVHSREMQIDLQAPLTIDSVHTQGQRLTFRREGDAWFIKMPKQQHHSLYSVTIYYSGRPKESTHAPWDGGVVWSKDSLGRPWISVACQLIGASAWYPCKVYQDDEPDRGATISVIVPDTLTGIANGRLLKKVHHTNGVTTYKWAVISPINNYGITFYIGKYVILSDTFHGEKGQLDIQYCILDYNKSKAASYLKPEVHRTLKVFEYWLGPYPFYADGFKMVEAPYIGMEHQSAIAYGNHFMHGRYGGKKITHWDTKVDRMISHENAHEWFGNSITVKDVADRWVHEGFAGYVEELVIESFYGRQAAKEFFHDRSRTREDSIMISDQPLISAHDIFKDAGDGMYMQGWALIHMLRAIINRDVKFRNILRGLNGRFYHQTVTSTQIENYISQAAGKDFSLIFDQYLRTAQLPVLEYSIHDDVLHYRLTNCIPGLALPVKTSLTKDRWIDATTSWKEITVSGINANSNLKVDTDFYVGVKRIE